MADDPLATITVAEYPDLAAAQASRGGDPKLSNYRQAGNYFMATEAGVGDVIIGRTPLDLTGTNPNGTSSGLEGLLHSLGLAGQLNQGSDVPAASSGGIFDLLPSSLDALKLPTLPKWFWWLLVAGVVLVVVGGAGKGQGSRRYARG